MASATASNDGGAEVAVIGLGYVGLTLAVALAGKGVRTLGYDRAPAVAQAVAARRPPFEELGIGESLRLLPADALVATDALPEQLPPLVVVCVGTPVEAGSREPDLSQLLAALDQIGPRLDPETVVVVRSTVPVGATEGLVRERLGRHVEAPRLAFCPERTIQGQALAELTELPQVIGSSDPTAIAATRRVFERLGTEVTAVSSAATAEMVKLVCNAHTDVLYGFGNEVALMAHALGIDATEVIEAANRGYPRPDIARPGFVGGSCLTKDPYLLSHSVAASGRRPLLVDAARRLNEEVPVHVAERVLARLAADGVDPAEASVLVSGIAYKGRPVTDDARGGAAGPLAARLEGEVGRLLGHDYVVAAERIAALGFEPVDLRQGFEAAHAAVLLVDHPGYQLEDAVALADSMRAPRVVYDMWGVWRQELGDGDRAYLRLGDD